MTDWPVWLKAAAQVGFPIVVALWLLFRADMMMADTQRAVHAHAEAMQSSNDLQVLLLRQICRNGAHSELGANYCNNVGLITQ